VTPVRHLQGHSSGKILAWQSPLENRRYLGQRNGMLVTLPDNLEARPSPQSTALHLAIGLFVSDESTLGQSAQVAGLSQAVFLREVGRRRIPIHYGREELAAR